MKQGHVFFFTGYRNNVSCLHDSKEISVPEKADQNLIMVHVHAPTDLFGFKPSLTHPLLKPVPGVFSQSAVLSAGMVKKQAPP